MIETSKAASSPRSDNLHRHKRNASCILGPWMLVLLWSFGASAEERPISGHIVSMSLAAESDIAINRNAPPPPAVSYLAPIYPGDEFLIKNGAWLEIRRTTGVFETYEKSERISKSSGEEKPDEPDIFSNALTYLGQQVTSWLDSQPDLESSSTITPMISRGDDDGEFDAPLLDSTSSLRVIAGERPLALEWNGGKPPFTISILPAGSYDSMVPAWQGIETQHIGPASVTLLPGNYDLMIEDADGNDILTSLEAVDAQAMPLPPASLQRTKDAEKDLAHFAFLAWLTSRDSSWSLEGYLQARELAERLPPADILAERLADGRTMPLQLD